MGSFLVEGGGGTRLLETYVRVYRLSDVREMGRRDADAGKVDASRG